MNTDKSFENLKSYFNRKTFHGTGKEIKKVEVIEPFITISRETGAGGISLGENLVSYLNIFDTDRKKDWMLYDKNILEKVLSDNVISREIENLIPEKKIPELQSIFEQLFKLHPSTQTIVHKISRTILQIASMGNAIIVGRGANIITRELKCGLHIRLISSMDKRIKQIQEIMNLDKVHAAKFIENEDKDRKQYIWKNFSREIDDASLYSIVINLAKINIEDAVRIIAEEAKDLRVFK
ncbi:MAG: cytidylate kinase-like family protein [Ignavibacteria bacterium]|nr:cytidylate kinase-like family protein [Ignavibacteria bacterium]